MDARRANAINRQIAMEREAQAAKQAKHDQLCASMPDDLRELYQLGLGFDAVRRALLEGMFPTIPHAAVGELREFMHRHVLHVDRAIVEHERFAEFFPEQAAKAEALAAANAAQGAAVSGPAVTLVGPDGAPLDLAPAPGIIHVGECS